MMLCWKYTQHTSLVMNISKVRKPHWEGKNNYCLALIYFCIKYKGKIQLFVLELASWVPPNLLLKFCWAHISVSLKKTPRLLQQTGSGADTNGAATKSPGVRLQSRTGETTPVQLRPAGWAAQPGGSAKERVERWQRGSEEEIDWWRESLPSLRHRHQTSHHQQERIPSCTFPSPLHQCDGVGNQERKENIIRGLR